MKKNELIEFSNSRTNNADCHFKSYDDYINWQTKTGASFESESEVWKKGQERYIDMTFNDVDKNAIIMDVCCGDGVGLRHFNKKGFINVIGFEVNDDKITKAKESGYKVDRQDICSDYFDEKYNEYFDIIYSSHSLEHVLNPVYTIKNLDKLLKPGGKMNIVLPYLESKGGDTSHKHFFMVHCGTIPLKLNIDDGGVSVCEVFENLGYQLINKKFDNFREPEIWLTLQKK